MKLGESRKMGAQRKSYGAEFKREAVRLAEEPGMTLARVARDLGIAENLLGKWRRQAQIQQEKAFPGHGKSVETELSHLRRENEILRRERDILKKAVSIFSQPPQ